VPSPVIGYSILDDQAFSRFQIFELFHNPVTLRFTVRLLALLVVSMTELFPFKQDILEVDLKKVEFGVCFVHFSSLFFRFP